MIAILFIGSMGLVIFLTGLSVLLRKPMGTTLPPRGPALGLMGLGLVLAGIAMWGQKNPNRLQRILKPQQMQCPKIFDAGDLYYLTQVQATQFTGQKVDATRCQYDIEFRSGKKVKAIVDTDLAAHQDDWLKTCGNHPLTQGLAEVWLKRLDNEEQLVCFLTRSFQGALWLAKEDDGLKWQRLLQKKLPLLVDE